MPSRSPGTASRKDWPTRRRTNRNSPGTRRPRREPLNRPNCKPTNRTKEPRAAAARVRELETQKALAAAEEIIAKAREATAQDHARMLAELKREVGRLVVQTTATVTGKILTPDDQRRLADETAKELATK